MIQGRDGEHVVIEGNSTVRYSVEALSQIDRKLPQIYFIEGWREHAL
jgi:hypothetical protein